MSLVRSSSTHLRLQVKSFLRSASSRSFLHCNKSFSALHTQNTVYLRDTNGYRSYGTSRMALSDADPSDTDPKSASVRPKLRVRDILRTVENKNFTISSSATVADAVAHLVDEKLASNLVVSPESGAVLGIFTARDLLKFIKATISANPRGLNESMTSTKVTEVMTRREKLVHCSPDDTVKRCREIMFQCKIRNMPVIEDGIVKGILTMKLLADSSFNLQDIGGKKGFIHNVTGRRGLPDSVKVQKISTVIEGPGGSGAVAITKLDAEIGMFALPHPFKRAEGGVAMDRRHYGPSDLATDLSLIEDASFALRVSEKDPSRPLPLSALSEPSQIYLCVADGVGSWRQYNVDPRLYSHALVDNAQKIIAADFQHRALIHDSPFQSDLDPIHPLDVIMDAWNLTTSAEINGASTICVATLDKKLSQLSYSNLGDCGLMVVRHIDSETAGYMRERQMPRHLRKNDLRIAYLSQQQLRAFNLPYQLGFSNIPEVSNASFESPSDADTASIPVMPGDVIVLATDGLFDNVDLDEIVGIIADWEARHFSPATEDSVNARSSKGNEAVQALAEQLVRMAREVSLDTHRDSPFAILAKENDIMWGGGMPDDTTVIVARIVPAS
ncbi:CBS domain-containing protein [archaeon]|nr:MAG: CBS domain-containing protein [archaeon]